MYHPFLASAKHPHDRLTRAYYWSVRDGDCCHYDYWQAQIKQSEIDYEQWCVEVAQADADAIHRGKGIAMREGYAMATCHYGHKFVFIESDSQIAEGPGPYVTPGLSLMGETPSQQTGTYA